MHWTRQTIIEEIRRLHKASEDLNYSSVETNHLSLVRASAWHYGNWRRAVEEAGIDYESLSKYRRWSKERIVARIQQLYAEGHDLSWRSVSQTLDPSLAASALRPNGFGSWPEAIKAAGLDINEVARYKYWTSDTVIKAIKERHKAGGNLSSRYSQKNDQSLFCAARRRFGTWDNALDAAGLDASKIRIRKPPHAAKKAEGAARADVTAQKKPAVAKKIAKAPAKRTTQLAAKPVTKTAAKTAVKPIVKVTAKATVKAAAKTTAKAATKPAAKPAVKAKPTVKPAAKGSGKSSIVAKARGKSKVSTTSKK